MRGLPKMGLHAALHFRKTDFGCTLRYFYFWIWFKIKFEVHLICNIYHMYPQNKWHTFFMKYAPVGSVSNNFFRSRIAIHIWYCTRITPISHFFQFRRSQRYIRKIICNLSNVTEKKVFKMMLIGNSQGHIDVGDGCWRPNVLVTSLRCWLPIQDVGDRFNTKVINMIILPPRSEIGHHHKVTNITMSPTSL